ncbi:sigma-70 family RNA polymerase sigma factor [Virgibacillus halodenitrificans]|uniref:Sigma-70 family RNA polymerase sigma factor n=1 Tax=Virgibacillus halodenitrificans TaxID=1482 RepID=A0ABR7VHW6_VIRHA|nr:sigma-70 family RNA polymerase sigma factor [Virgibacillus halodenitrificans]MBD1221521.1 sigma-70 family RNA polymerase sigma factor [Virgibacillus halodenitrificans]
MTHSYSFTDNEREKLKDPIVSNFLSDESNHKKLLAFIEAPNQKTKNALDDAFKSYYKRIKIITYIDRLIHFYSIDLDKKKNKYDRNHMLVLDKPIGEDSDMTWKDNITTNQPPILNSCRFSLEELLEDLHIYKAWATLSVKQKKILTLKYQYNLRDVEIADILSDTKQVVSYNHHKALKILKRAAKVK